MQTNQELLFIDTSQWSGEDESRLLTLKLLLEGYSNNCIAKELNFSLKNIESIIAKLFRRSSIITRGPFSHLINPRAKMLASGVYKDWLRYNVQEAAKNQELLSRNQYLTLVLAAAGSSNKAISEFLCISSKTVESRLNALFNQFNVNNQTEKQVNPRVRLIVTALTQKVLTPYAIKVSYEVLNPENWENIIQDREQIKETFLRLQFEQSRPYILQPDSYLGSLVDKLQNPSLMQESYSQTSNQNEKQKQHNLNNNNRGPSNNPYQYPQNPNWG
ncbi:MAG TPA: helix-turn-helix transcriptional regulator [Vampirovibrionales bacterium]